MFTRLAYLGGFPPRSVKHLHSKTICRCCPWYWKSISGLRDCTMLFFPLLRWCRPRYTSWPPCVQLLSAATNAENRVCLPVTTTFQGHNYRETFSPGSFLNRAKGEVKGALHWQGGSNVVSAWILHGEPLHMAHIHRENLQLSGEVLQLSALDSMVSCQACRWCGSHQVSPSRGVTPHHPRLCSALFNPFRALPSHAQTSNCVSSPLAWKNMKQLSSEQAKDHQTEAIQRQFFHI